MKIFIPLLALIVPAAADTLRTANVTTAINDVQIYPGSSAAHSAAMGEKVATPSSVQTGRKSRAELTFNDSTITRLGQNSVFSFREGGRNVELQQGSILLQVPKNAGGATIRTATVTAAITGTTVMFEYSPGKWVKLITLEGVQKVSINGGKASIDVPAGKMLMMHPNDTVIPQLITVDVAKVVATSPLAGDGTFGPLPPIAKALIQKTIEEQMDQKREGILLPTNYVISGAGNRSSDSIQILGGGDRTPPPPKYDNEGDGPGPISENP